MVQPTAGDGGGLRGKGSGAEGARSWALPSAPATLLLEVSRDLATAADAAAVAGVVTGFARRLLSADGAAFALRDNGFCHYVEEDAIAPLWKGQRFPLDACVSGWAMQHQAPMVVDDIAADPRVPQAPYRGTFVKSLVMVPVRQWAPVATIGCYWARPHRASDEEVALLSSLSDLTSVTLENVERAEALKRKAAIDEFLAHAGTLLYGSLDYEETLQNVGRLVVPGLADWFAVDLVVGDEIVQVAVAHRDPAMVEMARDLRARFGFDRDAPRGAGRVIRTGETDHGEVTAELLAEAALDDERRQIAEDLSLKAYITVPLISHRGILGALSFITTRESGRAFTQADVLLAEELGRRCGIAVENARLYSEAQAAVRARDEFLSIASHELRTPLTPLGIQLKMLELMMIAALGERADPFLERIATVDRQAKRIKRLIDDLLDISRIMGGRIRLELDDVDLVAVAEEVIRGHAVGEDGTGVHLHLEAPPWLIGRWDRVRLEQVVTNLVSNAVKYAPEAPIAVRILHEGEYAVLEVEDHGMGIPREAQERIFGRFERAVSSRNYGGLGVGLFISRQFVEAMGGSISVVSEQGEGSLFTVRLPLAGPPEGNTRVAPEGGEA